MKFKIRFLNFMLLKKQRWSVQSLVRIIRLTLYHANERIVQVENEML